DVASMQLLPTGVELQFGQALAGQDALGRRHLLIPTHEDEIGRLDERSRGVKLEVRHLLDGERPVPYVDFVCTIPDLNGLFGMVASDMLGSLRRGDTDVYGRCRNVLERWRRMLGSERRGVLSEEAQAALFAEL